MAKKAGRRAAGPQDGVAATAVIDLVMRSVNIPRHLDDRLRQLAFRYRVSKSDIIRAALAIKLAEWERAPEAVVCAELAQGCVGAEGATEFIAAPARQEDAQ